MGIIQTKVVDLRKLAKKQSASIVIRLMMAFNDLTISNNGLKWSKQHTSPTTKHLLSGMGQYFIRLQIGHLHEALLVIEDIHRDEYLMNTIRSCRQETIDRFERLLAYTRYGVKRKWFMDYCGIIRNNLSFHYQESGKLIDRALASRASREQTRLSTVTRGDQCNLWRFDLADGIVDSIVCREIFKIPYDKNLRSESDSMIGEIFVIFKDMVDFAGDFIYRYLE